MSDVDFIEKIHIAAYWRKQLGEYEYVNHNPDDLLRWFIALETRGADNIRAHLTERAGRYPESVVRGVVDTAPHPPLAIVELWLASRERISLLPYWTGAAAFCLFGYLVATNLQGCATLVNPNSLATSPPQMNAPVLTGGFSPMPAAPSTLPSQTTAPANAAASPSTSTSGGPAQ